MDDPLILGMLDAVVADAEATFPETYRLFDWNYVDAALAKEARDG